MKQQQKQPLLQLRPRSMYARIHTHIMSLNNVNFNDKLFGIKLIPPSTRTNQQRLCQPQHQPITTTTTTTKKTTKNIQTSRIDQAIRQHQTTTKRYRPDGRDVQQQSKASRSSNSNITTARTGGTDERDRNGRQHEGIKGWIRIR